MAVCMLVLYCMSLGHKVAESIIEIQPCNSMATGCHELAAASAELYNDFPLS